MEPIFRPRRLAHVNYWVNDWTEAAKWHHDIAGLDSVYRRLDIKGVFLSNGNTYHDSAVFDVHSKHGEGKTPGLHHMAFELENEVELVEGYKRLAEYGFNFDFTLSADVAHCCYGHDPEGNRFEVYADVKGDWRNQRSGDIDEGGRNPPWVPGSTPPVAESLYPKNPPIERIAGAALHTTRASHATLVAKDYATLYRHYTMLVGLTPIVGGPDTPFALLAGSTGEQSLAIFAPLRGVAPGLHHGGFLVESEADLTAAEAELPKRGQTVERVVDHPARKALYVRDPSGNLLMYFINRKASLQTLLELPPGEALWAA
jgi:catechol 2,3-dioxygenase